MIDIAPIIQETIDEGKPYIIPVGSHYIGSPVYLSLDDTVIVGSLPTNKGTYLWTDKPIDMFRVKPGCKIERPHIAGFTAKYMGPNIYGTECGVTRCGGYGDKEARFGIRSGYFDYDVYGGDPDYMRSRWNKKMIEHPQKGDIYINWRNPNYDFAINEQFDNVDNYTCSYTGGGAHGFWIDYNNALSERTSWCHGTTVKGHYIWVNTALKIDKRWPDGEQPINTLQVDLKVDYAKTFWFIRGVNRSYIRILGQNGPTRHCTYPLPQNAGNVPTWEEIMIPYHFADKISAVRLDYFLYDRQATGRSEYGGYLRGDGSVDVSGWNSLSFARNTDLYYGEGYQDNPHYVHMKHDQLIGGKKEFRNIEIGRFSELNILDPDGKFNIGNTRLRPREVNDELVDNLQALKNQLYKTGIISKKE